MNKNMDKRDNPDSFSLSIGGPLYHLLSRLRLLKKPLLLYQRRIIAIVMLTWLPLLLCSWQTGLVFGGAPISFFSDIEVHIRLLLVLSMLIYAEVIAHERIQVIVEQFLKCKLIALGNQPQFYRIIASSIRLRNSRLVEFVLILVVYTIGHWVSTKFLSLKASSWLAIPQNNRMQLTPAGYWYVFISLPIFQFVVLRWYYRILIWYRFLWQISRLPLQLNSLHPDRAGGLGFLANSLFALEPFLLAHSILLAGIIIKRIWSAGALLSDFKMEIFSTLIFVLLIPLLPLLFFIFQMIREKRMGTLHYGVIATHYVNDFRQKWLPPHSKKSTGLLGSADIQSLADLFNSFEVSNKMRITPFGRNHMITLVFFTALPLFPLALTMVPLEKMIGQILGLIF